MLIPDLNTSQILTLMGIDFIGYSLLGNHVKDQKIESLNKQLGNLKVRSLNSKVEFENQKRSVGQQLVSI